jgi:hypothetical protein
LPPLIKIGEYFVDEKETFSIDVCEFKGISYCNGCGSECNGGKSFRFVKIKDNSVYRLQRIQVYTTLTLCWYCIERLKGVL